MPRRAPPDRLIPGLVAALLAVVIQVAPAAVEGRSVRTVKSSETFVYAWRLEGVSGFFVRLLSSLPTTGDAVMGLELRGEGRLSVSFVATSEKAEAHEFWKYETSVDLGSWRTLEVRESLRFGKKDREKTFDLRALEVIDVLSGLHLLRYSPSASGEQRTIWSDGKTYPVLVSPLGTSSRVFDGAEVPVRGLTIRGARVPGERRWKASAEVWVTDDEAALPVELLYRESLGRLRLTLIESKR